MEIDCYEYTKQGFLPNGSVHEILVFMTYV